jgi:hypothetical protein
MESGASMLNCEEQVIMDKHWPVVRGADSISILIHSHRVEGAAGSL